MLLRAAECPGFTINTFRAGQQHERKEALWYIETIYPYQQQGRITLSVP
jgi:hypothetical protein